MRKLSKGDRVVMHTCHEATVYPGKVWEVKHDQYTDKSGQEVVFLYGFSGSLMAGYLQLVIIDEVTKVEFEPFTQEEDEIMIHLAEAHKLFIKLPITHPSDTPEWVHAIHRMQDIIGARILRREFPYRFPSYPKNSQTQG